MNRITGILFDLGDTLLDFGKVDIRSLFEQGAHLAYEYLQELGMPLPSFGRFHRQQNWAIRWKYFRSRISRREFNSLDVIGRLGLRMGHELSPDQYQELAWRWYRPLSQCATMEDGTPRLLRDLADAGLKLGLVSNTFVPSAVLDRHLRETGLLEMLPVRIYSCDARHRKPHRRIFRLALDALGTPPEATLFVGDSLRADIAGANRAGMISVLKDPLGLYEPQRIRPAHVINQLAELREIVAQYNEPGSGGRS
jgi:putative hydrolase of the HAD superfamily